MMKPHAVMVMLREIVAENLFERKNECLFIKLLSLSSSEMHMKQTQIKKKTKLPSRVPRK